VEARSLVTNIAPCQNEKKAGGRNANSVIINSVIAKIGNQLVVDKDSEVFKTVLTRCEEKYMDDFSSGTRFKPSSIVCVCVCVCVAQTI